MTNEERLKSLSTDELAEELTECSEYYDSEYGERIYISPVDYDSSFSCVKASWRKWLKEEAK